MNVLASAALQSPQESNPSLFSRVARPTVPGALGPTLVALRHFPLRLDNTPREARAPWEGLSHTLVDAGWEQITYATPEGWIESINLKTQRIERLVQGQVPAWSPDGKRLAYYWGDSEGGAVFTYDPARRISREVYRPSGWIRGFFGDLYWSPDGRYLSFNVGVDLMGSPSGDALW